MKNLQKKGFVVPLIILIVAAIVIGGGTYYSKKRSTSLVVPDLQEMSDWKTYRSERYGFEFKYPPTWFMLEGSLSLYDRMVGPHLPGVNKFISFRPQWDKSYSERNRYKDEDMKAYSERFAEFNVGPGEPLDRSAQYLFGAQSNFYQVSTKTINRHPVWGCESDPCPPPPQKDVEHRLVTTYIPRGDSVFVITASVSPSNSSVNIDLQEEKEYLKMYQKILATFKFVE